MPPLSRPTDRRVNNNRHVRAQGSHSFYIKIQPRTTRCPVGMVAIQNKQGQWVDGVFLCVCFVCVYVWVSRAWGRYPTRWIDCRRSIEAQVERGGLVAIYA